MFVVSRAPLELGCCAGMSLLLLQNTVTAARLTSFLSTVSRSSCPLSQGICLFGLGENCARAYLPFFFLASMV
uniref:Uncharacterized protein n=1 Tax=Aegilops tauschii subsp. strangulata TaxID=200361 RepID=A0A453IK13_AEGTS